MKITAAIAAAAMLTVAAAALLLLPSRNTATAALDAAPPERRACTPRSASARAARTRSTNPSPSTSVVGRRLLGLVDMVGLRHRTSLRHVGAARGRRHAGICAPVASTDWRVFSLTPAVVASCVFQDSAATTGVLAAITFVCIGNGTSALHLQPDPYVGPGPTCSTRSPNSLP